MVHCKMDIAGSGFSSCSLPKDYKCLTDHDLRGNSVSLNLLQGA